MGKLAGQHKKNGTAKKLQGNQRGDKKSKMRLGKNFQQKFIIENGIGLDISVI